MSDGSKVILALKAGQRTALEVAGPGGGRLEIGSGITFQLTYARQLTTSRFAALYFEVPALAIPLQDIKASNGIIPSNYDSFFVTPALRVKLAPSAGLSPWFSAGGGYALFDESANRINVTHNTTRGTSGGALQFGGGVDVRTQLRCCSRSLSGLKDEISILQSLITTSTREEDFSTMLCFREDWYCTSESWQPKRIAESLRLRSYTNLIVKTQSIQLSNRIKLIP